MSDELHVVYRHVGPSSWEAYSRPVSIHTDGRTLEQARDNFAVAAGFHFGEDWPQVVLAEHIERPVADGVFVRTAVDRRTLDRDRVLDVFKASLTIPAQLEQLQTSGVPVASTGDVIFVACVDSDRLSWLIAQLGRADAFQVACLRGERTVWWMPLATPEAELGGESETLADAGLSSESATVADLIKASPATRPTGRAGTATTRALVAV